ncbi:hypothetical protein PR003_g12241 [Phytophthora rubi]|uniref:Thioredoxin domain-containing protein n=1 Tax=Phytophthora rubi TaxID=129364 RepID=A0A6A4FJ15_9STRA|nr:hypothetical protein PR003_g12241 [Phytophthora rubi]
MEGHDEELTIDVPEPLPESAPTLKPPAITTVGTEEQWEKLIQQNQESNKALVVDFRSTWCKPSLVIAPFFEELSGRFPAAVFARVDVDELETVMEEFNVSSCRVSRCSRVERSWMNLAGPPRLLWRAWLPNTPLTDGR